MFDVLRQKHKNDEERYISTEIHSIRTMIITFWKFFTDFNKVRLPNSNMLAKGRILRTEDELQFDLCRCWQIIMPGSNQVHLLKYLPICKRLKQTWARADSSK